MIISDPDNLFYHLVTREKKKKKKTGQRTTNVPLLWPQAQRRWADYKCQLGPALKPVSHARIPDATSEGPGAGLEREKIERRRLSRLAFPLPQPLVCSPAKGEKKPFPREFLGEFFRALLWSDRRG